MVQIIVKMNTEQNEWGMVELQGALESKDHVGFNGLYIGDLHFDDKGTPNLIVGHHLLVGKVVELEKPFAVLKKNNEVNGNETETNTMEIENVEKRQESIAQHNYEIIAFIKRKVIFKNRPRPIITNTVIKK